MYLRTELYKGSQKTVYGIRTVKRTYYSKKLGKKVTKTYQYEFKYKRPPKGSLGGYGSQGLAILQDKYGKKTKTYTELIKDIDKNYTEAQATAIKTDLNKHLRKASEKGVDYQMSTFFSHMQGMKFDNLNRLVSSKRNILRYIYNMGGDPDELAGQIGVSTSELLDENNWDGDEFSFGGRKYILDVRYQDGVVRWVMN